MAHDTKIKDMKYYITQAITRPHRIVPYFYRMLKAKKLLRAPQNHMQYYAGVVDDIAKKNPNLAVGSTSEKSWDEIGKYQFEYFLKHGLDRTHKFLDIGCGNLRSGWRFIDFLDVGNYVGIDISKEVLTNAHQNISRYGLQDKRPYLYIVKDTDYSFLQERYFDIVHAHSVFSHCPLDIIESCMFNVIRVIKKDGIFDFTFHGSDKIWHTAHQDFYYPVEFIIALCEKCGYHATELADWEHPSQRKLRARLKE